MTLNSRYGQTFSEAAAATIQDFGGLLRCTVCGREEPLGNIAGNLRNGWPRCHDLTMRWWTQRQLDAGEDRG